MNLIEVLVGVVIAALISTSLIKIDYQTFTDTRTANELNEKSIIAEKISEGLRELSTYADINKDDGRYIIKTSLVDDKLTISITGKKSRVTTNFYSYYIGDKEKWLRE